MASIRKIRAVHLRRMPRVIAWRRFDRSMDHLQQDFAAALTEAIEVQSRWPQAMVDMIAEAVRKEVLAPVVAEALASQAVADGLEA